MKYFLYSPEETLWFDNDTEWKNAVDSYDFLGNHCDDGWDCDVEDVMAGKAPNEFVLDREQCHYDQLLPYATLKSKMCDLAKRPPDSELDEEGQDSEGRYWGEYDYYCNYFFVDCEGQEK